MFPGNTGQELEKWDMEGKESQCVWHVSPDDSVGNTVELLNWRQNILKIYVSVTIRHWLNKGFPTQGCQF